MKTEDLAGFGIKQPDGNVELWFVSPESLAEWGERVGGCFPWEKRPGGMFCTLVCGYMNSRRVPDAAVHTVGDGIGCEDWGRFLMVSRKCHPSKDAGLVACLEEAGLKVVEAGSVPVEELFAGGVLSPEKSVLMRRAEAAVENEKLLSAGGGVRKPRPAASV